MISIIHFFFYMLLECYFMKMAIISTQFQNIGMKNETSVVLQQSKDVKDSCLDQLFFSLRCLSQNRIQIERIVFSINETHCLLSRYLLYQFVHISTSIIWLQSEEPFSYFLSAVYRAHFLLQSKNTHSKNELMFMF